MGLSRWPQRAAEAQSAVSKLPQGVDYIGAAQMGRISSGRRITNLAGISWLSPGLTAVVRRKQTFSS